jgi:hypothetical protein
MSCVNSAEIPLPLLNLHYSASKMRARPQGAVSTGEVAERLNALVLKTSKGL